MVSPKFIISEFYEFKSTRKLIEQAEMANKPVIMTGILQKADTINRNGRVYPLSILKREAEKYMEVVEEGGAMGECVPAGTQIFTTSGWINIEDAKEGDTILSLDYEKNILEEQQITRTTKRLCEDDLIHIYNGKNLDMKITRKHQVVLWNGNNKPYTLTGERLYKKILKRDPILFNSYIKNSGQWIGQDIEFFELGDLKIKMEDWVSLVGAYLAYGTFEDGKIKMWVSNGGDPKKVERLENLLNVIGLDYIKDKHVEFLINNQHLYNNLSILSNGIQHSYSEKYIPQYLKQLQPRLLEILLDWIHIEMFYSNRKSGKQQTKYTSESKKLIDDITEIILKIGDGVVHHDTVETTGFYCVQQKKTKGIHLNSGVIQAKILPYKDYVYCVTVPNSTWLMKSDGKISWTHNCDHPESSVVSLANVSHKVTDMWWQGDVLYGKVQITETPMGDILKGLLKSEVRLGISSRGVGSVKTKQGKDIVQDDFELIAFDFVSSPSTPGAYMFKESREWGLTPLLDGNQKIKIATADDLNEEIEKYNKLKEVMKNNFWKNL